MERLRRYLMEPGDDSLLRSWLGIVVGVCTVCLPVLFGVMDLRTCLIASTTGALPSLVFWRQIGEPLNKPLPVMALVTLFLLGIVVVAANLGSLAWFTYTGAWILVLSVMRLVTGWRDPQGPPPQPEDSPDPANRPLAWVALVLPLLLLIGVIVVAIAIERGAIG